MYKDKLQGKKVEKENTEYTVLDEIKENEVPKAPENQEQQQVLETPANIIKSTRLSRLSCPQPSDRRRGRDSHTNRLGKSS